MKLKERLEEMLNNNEDPIICCVFGKDKDAIATERRASKILKYCIDEILYSNIVFEEKRYIGIDFIPLEKYVKTDGWCEVTERRCNPHDCEYYFDKGGCGYGGYDHHENS